jgi:hypothetical protein
MSFTPPASNRKAAISTYTVASIPGADRDRDWQPHHSYKAPWLSWHGLHLGNDTAAKTIRLS